MKKQKWLLQATILGLAFFFAILLVKPVGVSTQFSVVSGIAYHAVDSNLITKNSERESGYQSTNAYYDKDEGKLAKQIMHPWTYDLIFVLAIPLGAWIGYLLLDRRRKIKVVEEVSCDGKKKRRWFMGYGPSFLSGFLLLFGARMAGGCTSGHMMSGMMQSSVSGFVFAMVVFAIAIPTAILTGKRSRREKN